MYFHYELRNHGWATARLGPDDNVVVMTVSDLTDSLRELAVATQAICSGTSDVEVLFEDEPGEHWLRLHRIDNQFIEYAIIWKDDHDKPEERKCSGKVAIAEFKAKIVSELRRIFTEYGESGYREKWSGSEFPTTEMRELEKAG